MAEAAHVETIQPTSWQARVLAVPEEFDVFLGGGRGGGKSYACLLLALSHVEQYGANARVLIVRRDFPSLRDLEGEARNLFRAAYGKALGHNAADHVFKFPSGAVVRFDQIEGAQDFHKFQGQSFSLIIADEAGQWSDPQPLDMLRSSLRSKAGVPTRFVLSANPGGPGHHWLLQRHVAGVHPWTPYVERASQREFITAPSVLSDNPNLPADYRKQIEAATATDPELRKAWISGDWHISRGAYFSHVFATDRNVIQPWTVKPSTHALQGMTPFEQRQVERNAKSIGRQPNFGWRYFLTLDHGSAAPAVCYIVAKSPGAEGPDGQFYPRDSLILMDEIAFVDGANLNSGLEMTVPDMCRDIRERCEYWRVPARGVADDATFAKHGSGAGSLADEYRRSGVAVQPARKADRLSGWEAMRRLMADAGKPDKPGLYVSERCWYFLATVPTLPRDPKRPEDLDTKSPDHAADAVRYAVTAEAAGATRRIRTITGLM
jgi:hypothetical protein